MNPPPASAIEAAIQWAVLGSAALEVYDMTNLATLRGYTPTMATVDTA